MGNFYKKKYIFKTTCYVWSRKAGTSTLANGEMLDLGPLGWPKLNSVPRKAGTSTLANGEMLDLGPLGRPKLKPKKVEEQFRWTMGP